MLELSDHILAAGIDVLLTTILLTLNIWQLKLPITFLAQCLSAFFVHIFTLPDLRFEKLAGAKEEYYHTLDDAIYDLACEAFVLLPGWENSQGSRRDCERAKNKKKLIFELPSYESSDIDSFLMTLFEWACKPV